MSEKAKTISHPSTDKMFRAAHQRFLDVRHLHARACDLMWAGTLAASFTPAELHLIRDLLSPRDYALLAAVKRARS